MSFRRTWDKEYYAQKAKERADGTVNEEAAGVTAQRIKNSTKEEFQAAESDAAGPMGSDRAFLKAREGKIDFF